MWPWLHNSPSEGMKREVHPEVTRGERGFAGFAVWYEHFLKHDHVEVERVGEVNEHVSQPIRLLVAAVRANTTMGIEGEERPTGHGRQSACCSRFRFALHKPVMSNRAREAKRTEFCCPKGARE